MNGAINALAGFDRYLSGLKLDRDEHVAIQMHIAKIRQEFDACWQRGNDGT
jgi:hypothetical protein